MIEQIINWWNSLTMEIQGLIRVYLFFFALATILLVVGETLLSIEKLKDKHKTITQKYREGLIKK